MKQTQREKKNTKECKCWCHQNTSDIHSCSHCLSQPTEKPMESNFVALPNSLNVYFDEKGKLQNISKVKEEYKQKLLRKLKKEIIHIKFGESSNVEAILFEDVKDIIERGGK